MICQCGCSKQRYYDIIPVTENIKCDFKIENSDLAGELTINAEGDLSLIFTSPDNIKDTGIRIKEECFIIEVHGISNRYPINEAPKDSPAICLYDAFNASKSISPTLIDDVITVKGSSESCDFSMEISNAGYITKISLGDHTVFLFSNHVAIK